MKCVICKKGETKLGKATITLERDGVTLLIREVPAEICQNCGEEYIDEKVTADLLRRANDAAKTGVQLDVRKYKAA